MQYILWGKNECVCVCVCVFIGVGVGVGVGVGEDLRKGVHVRVATFGGGFGVSVIHPTPPPLKSLIVYP